MRSFRVDPAYTNRALLNGKTYFLRGTTFCLLRFFDDPLCRDQPWDRAWVRTLFRRFTALEMNACRFCISAMPDLWYDVADEEGMIVEDEYPIWYAYRPGVSSGDMSALRADPKQLRYRHLARETPNPATRRRIHGLGARALEPSLGLPLGRAERNLVPGDRRGDQPSAGTGPVRQALGQRLVAAGLGERLPRGHQYFEGSQGKSRPFRIADLADLDRVPTTFYAPLQHTHRLAPNDYLDRPCILNEYAALAQPRRNADYRHEAVLRRGLGTSGNRRPTVGALRRYLAALTEYWRSSRTCFGVSIRSG